MAQLVLVVDDDPVGRDLFAETLRLAGYEVTLARDGFEALLLVEDRRPALVISDLNMPRMSGFELLSVLRRRYPEIAVICVSGEFTLAVPPPYVVCDAFLNKGTYKLCDFRARVAEVLAGEPRKPLVKPDGAVVWLPRGVDGYYVVTCTHCLRSFPVRSKTEDRHSEHHMPCIHCDKALNYYIEGNSKIAAA